MRSSIGEPSRSRARKLRNCHPNNVSTTLYTSASAESSASSPNDLESFVEPKFLIGSHNRNLLELGLGNDLAIKGIAVVKRQREQLKSMLRGVGQYSNV